MKVLLCGDFDGPARASWLTALQQALPEVQWLDLAQARDAHNASQVQAAVVANPPSGSLQGLPNLRLIQSLWAGVDRLLADATLPAGVPVARMVDPAMNAAMAQTALWAVLSLHRGYFAYARQQQLKQWHVHPQRRADEVTVRVLGQGQMGQAVTQRLLQMGYAVQGFSRSAGQPLLPFLADCQILVNLLPLTEPTRGVLDARCFAAMPPGASVVNLARGAHLVEADLLAALDRGHLQHAVLDVFQTEPLPNEHPFWSHPQITVLPHAAAMTDERSAAQVVAQNLRLLTQSGDAMPAYLHLVDRSLGY
jgi:glyoxylate/hydroxypyruvate reductase A